ncbi:hypothetical protein AB852_08490 [Streptomyces uncialis]|uniref:Uncharacterized protein n=1 Tax=Streptomyces uncialis TaxID=1048205 RepID=A0A1Q4V9E4_9ACTN|nr:hypothetical protein AB852_08490 [Streptomyces uncialis]
MGKTFCGVQGYSCRVGTHTGAVTDLLGTDVDDGGIWGRSAAQVQSARALAEQAMAGRDTQAFEESVALWEAVLRDPTVPDSILPLLELVGVEIGACPALGSTEPLSRGISRLDEAIARSPEARARIDVQRARLTAYGVRASLTESTDPERSAEDWLTVSGIARSLAESATDGSIEQGERFETVGRALLMSHELALVPGALGEAVISLRRAVAALTGPRRKAAEACYLLGRALRLRGERDRSRDDLDEAVALLGRAVAEADFEGSSIMPYLSNLGFAYIARYRLLGGLDSLNDTMSALARALAASPDPVESEHRLQNLVNLAGERIRVGGYAHALLSHMALVESRLTTYRLPQLAGWMLLDLALTAYSRAVSQGSVYDYLLAVVIFRRCALLIPADMTTFDGLLTPSGDPVACDEVMRFAWTLDGLRTLFSTAGPSDSYAAVLTGAAERIEEHLRSSGAGTHVTVAGHMAADYELALFVHLDNLGVAYA